MSHAIRGGDDVLTMFEKWVEERKPPDKTVLDFRTAIRRFAELHGNPPVHEITKAHVRAYKEALQRLPRSCSGEMRRMPLPELLAQLERRPIEGPTLSAGSVNKAIGALQTVFGWIEDQGYLDAYPNRSNPAARMWSRYTDDLGIDDPRKVFHSFRHAFKRACRAARIEEELHDALTGHTSASVGRTYGDGVPLEVLAEVVAKVSYKGLDLCHLHLTNNAGANS